MPEFSPKLTPSALAIFVVLMAEPRPLTNKDLADRLCVRKPDSTGLGVLRKNGLLREAKVGRLTTYALSDSGWERGTEVVSVRLEGKGSAAGALLALAQGLKGGFDATEISPRAFFDRSGAPVDFESLIRKVYTELAKVDGDWVSLADIRDRLGSPDDQAVSQAFVAL